MASLFFMVVVLAFTSTRAALNLMEVMVEQNVTVFPDLVETAQLSDMLANTGPLTLVLPTDEAFRAMPASYVKDLQADPVALKDYVLYHIMKGNIFSWTVPGRTSVKSMNGHSLRLAHYMGGILFGRRRFYINNAKVLRHDLKASNGVIHMVDSVLRPPHGTIEEVISHHPNLTQISKISLLSHMSNYLNKTKAGSRVTFFAPTDEAFANMNPRLLKKAMSSRTYSRTLIGYHLHTGALTYDLLKQRSSRSGYISTHLFFDDILLSHGKDGEPRLNQNTKIVTHDIECDNGVVHLIDHVLIPSSPFNWG